MPIGLVAGYKVGGRMGMTLTIDKSIARGAAQIFIESARRLLKPDGKYNDANQMFLYMFQSVAEQAACSDAGEYQRRTVLQFEAEYDGGGSIRYQIKIPEYSVNMNETV